MRTLFLSLCLLPLLLFADEKSQQNGLEWLKIVDKGEYGKSWDVASLTLRLKIPKKVWEQLLDYTRRPLGSVQKRALLQELDSKDPENLPKGDYKIQVYSTEFSTGAGKEVLMLIQETDGTWRALTYHSSK